MLHDPRVGLVETLLARYVGAKYACAVNSATSAIFLALVRNKDLVINAPSLLPPVVANAIITSGNKVNFIDDINWVGGSYTLHNFGDYKIIDSAQKLEHNQFAQEANAHDLMIFSFYPTKPLAGIDGGLVVSNDKEKINWFREAVFNGMGTGHNSWNRDIKFPGWKMYMNSVQAVVILNNFRTYELKLKKLKDIRIHYNYNFGCNNTSNHLYRINVVNNETISKNLHSRDIATGLHYKCLHKHPVYAQNTVLEKSEIAEKQTLSIPFNEKLSDDEITHIINNVKPHLV